MTGSLDAAVLGGLYAMLIWMAIDCLLYFVTVGWQAWKSYYGREKGG